MSSSKKRKNTFPSKLKTASTFYPKGTMSKSAGRIYKVSMNPKYAPGGPGSAIKWLTYYMNRAGKNLKNRKEIMKARRMLQKVNKSGPFRYSTKKKKSSRKRHKPKKKSGKPKKSSRKRHKPEKKSGKPKKSSRKRRKPKKKPRKKS
jgi:tRNA(adenine34) deaminase